MYLVKWLNDNSYPYWADLVIEYIVESDDNYELWDLANQNLVHIQGI